MITPSTLEFAGNQLTFIHVAISILSATRTGCLKEKVCLSICFSRDFRFSFPRESSFPRRIAGSDGMHRHKEPLQSKSASFLRIFSWSQLEIVRNVSFYTRLEDWCEVRRCFWIKQCWTPASWNRITLVRGHFDSMEWVVSLDKSILHLQFISKTSNSTLVLFVHVCDCFC